MNWNKFFKRYEISWTYTDYSIKDYEYFWFKRNALKSAKKGKDSVVFVYVVDSWFDKIVGFIDHRRIVKGKNE